MFRFSYVIGAAAVLAVMAGCQDARDVTAPIHSRGGPRFDVAPGAYSLVIGTGLTVADGAVDPGFTFYCQGAAHSASVVPSSSGLLASDDGSRSDQPTPNPELFAMCDSVTMTFDLPGGANSAQLTLNGAVAVENQVGPGPSLIAAHLNDEATTLYTAPITEGGGATPSVAFQSRALVAGHNQLTFVAGIGGSGILDAIRFKATITYDVGTQCSVTSLLDDGPGSLRANIADAGCSAIVFDPSLAPGVIHLTSGALHITHDVIILGPGGADGSGNPSLMTVSGENAHRVFEVDPGTNAGIEYLTISGGILAQTVFRTETSGGGLLNFGSTTVSSSVFTANEAYAGGAIANMAGGTLHIDESTLTSGAGVLGKALYNAGTALVTRSAIVNNGGHGTMTVYNDGGALTMQNSTVSGNPSSQAAINNVGGALDLLYVTVTLNTGPTGTFAGVSSPEGVGTVHIANSIIDGNARTECVSGVPVTGGHNLLGTGSTCSFASDANNVMADDPKLGLLAANGGATLSQLPLAGSPAIDAIPLADCDAGAPASTWKVDQRGRVRPQGAGCDIGAVEVVAVVAPVDNTPPVIVPTLTGTLGANGWYTSNVQVDWTDTDAESKITVATGCTTTTVTADTPGVTFTCSATSAGGTTSKTVTIRRDASAPVIAFGGATSYTVDQSVAITCSAADPTSGVSAQTCPTATGPAYAAGAGSHTLTATATNGAGLTSVASFTYTVSVTSASLSNLVNLWVTNDGEANSLTKKLAHGDIAPFINEVQAQTGKKIAADKAAILIQLAQSL